MNNTVVVDICPLKIYIHEDNIIWIKGDELFKLSSHIMTMVVSIIVITPLSHFFYFINTYKTFNYFEILNILHTLK